FRTLSTIRCPSRSRPCCRYAYCRKSIVCRLCGHSPFIFSARAYAVPVSVARTFEAITSSHSPSRMKICDGMCWACGIAGASFAPRRRVAVLPELMKYAHRLPPMRHSTRVICGDCRVELLCRFLVPERVEQCDSPLELNLRCGRAR